VEGISVTLHIDVHHEALADYSLLIAEATAVLSALAAAQTAAERADELTELRAIHAEGGEFRAATPLASSLRRLFDGLMGLGESLATAQDVDAAQQARAHALQRLTQALAAALDEPAAAGPALDHVNQELHALDPGLVGALDLEAAAAAAAGLFDTDQR
jgi:hypothetical protein